MNLFAIFLIVAAVLVLLFFAALAIVFDMTFAPKRKEASNYRIIPSSSKYIEKKNQILDHVEAIAALDFEEIYAKSFDGLTLFGRYYKRSENNILKIEFHGYRSHGFRDFCGSRKLNDTFGLNSLTVDMRSHGNSEGSAITFGIKERYDVITWVEKAIEKCGNDVKIILSGVSMGAATVLMASELDLPKNVIGIIADCPYSSPGEIIRTVAGYRHFNPRLVYPLVKLSARIFAGVDIDSASPVEAVKNTNIPILIVHGDEDKFVPYYMGRKIFEACASENKRFVTGKGADHALSYFCDVQGYTKAVGEFLEEII
jgi:fermentation-respiration switch protein FrsA (DUF1100 family)